MGGGEGSIIGAVLGLIQVMRHLDYNTEVGRGIAVAFGDDLRVSQQKLVSAQINAATGCVAPNYAKAPRISQSGRSQL